MIKEKIIEYYDKKIVTIRKQERTIIKLEDTIKDLNKQLIDSTLNEAQAINRMNKFKEEFVNEHKQFKEYETLKEKQIEELKKQIKDLEKENKKLEKGKKNEKSK